jgi:GNAT superfamily N-acetyltransferase
MEITYQYNAEISVESAINLYNASTLGERRPVDRPDIFEGMLKNADVTITAWHEGRLVGICRALTDYTYVAYIADLAVAVAYQKKGIGKRLIKETRAKLGKECLVVLLAAPKANEYYAKLGFEHNPRAWMLKAGDHICTIKTSP